MKEYLAKLNEKQYNACVDVEGPSLIIAGAGSGKTRVLTNRIAYMINDCGIAPYNILAITFTNKAAKEMNDRLQNQIGDDAKFVTCKTFHSFSAYLLRREIEVLKGRKRNFQIIDDDETESLIRESMNELNLDTKLLKPKSFATYISLIKANINTLQSYSGYLSDKIEMVMQKYEEKLIANNLLDFDDLLRLVIEVFKKDPSVLDKYQERFRYILVDEFQDSSNIQYEFISMLGEKYSNVFIVGDEDQSIYSFRGANIENIKKFMKEFKGYHKHILDQNYRSAPEILEISNKLIANNENRIEKSLWTDRERGDGVKLHKFDSDKLEARFVSTIILRDVQAGKYKYKDFAILYRNNYLSRNFENELIEHKIPYRVYSGLSFYKRKEVKDILGYLRLVLDQNDFFSFQRVIKTPSRGVGDTSLKKIGALFEVNGDLEKSIEDAKISQSTKDEIGIFMMTIKSLAESLKDPNTELKTFVSDVYKRTGYKAFIDEIEDDDEKEMRTENIMELFTAISEAEVIGDIYETLAEFLNNVSLLTDQDLENKDDNCVALITMHSAKGLEYPNVFAVALEDDTIPGMRAIESGDIEEERRLLYVCLTRAKDNLYISACKDRYKFGQHIASKPSRFIKELGVVFEEDKVTSKPKTTVTFGTKKPVETGSFKTGDRVFHSMHGEGVIKAQVEGFYIIKFDKKPSPMKIIVNHPLLKKLA